MILLFRLFRHFHRYFAAISPLFSLIIFAWYFAFFATLFAAFVFFFRLRFAFSCFRSMLLRFHDFLLIMLWYYAIDLLPFRYCRWWYWCWLLICLSPFSLCLFRFHDDIRLADAAIFFIIYAPLIFYAILRLTLPLFIAWCWFRLFRHFSPPCFMLMLSLFMLLFSADYALLMLPRCRIDDWRAYFADAAIAAYCCHFIADYFDAYWYFAWYSLITIIFAMLMLPLLVAAMPLFWCWCCHALRHLIFFMPFSLMLLMLHYADYLIADDDYADIFRLRWCHAAADFSFDYFARLFCFLYMLRHWWRLRFSPLIFWCYFAFTICRSLMIISPMPPVSLFFIRHHDSRRYDVWYYYFLRFFFSPLFRFDA